MHAEREFININDRLSTFLPKVGAFRRRRQRAKEQSCEGLTDTDDLFNCIVKGKIN